MKKVILIIALIVLLSSYSAVGQNQVPQSSFDRYNFFPITLLVLIAIVLTELFIKDKLLLKYVWNLALLISFIAAAITALLYFLRIEGLHALIVTLHVELGLVAVWVGLYHAFRRLNYYLKCRPKLKGSKECKID